MPLEGPNGDAHMRKNTSFAVAAIALVFTIAFCAWSNVVAISPDMLRPQAGMPYGADVGSFLPIKRIEPAALTLIGCQRISKNSKANRIETGERSGGIGEICSVEVDEK